MTNPPRPGPAPTPRRAVVAFMAAGLGAVVVIGAIGFGVARRTARSEAVRDAREVTTADERAVHSLITDAVVAGDPAALDQLGAAVSDRVLTDRVVRVKVWDADGRIVFSDERSLVGRRFVIGDDEVDALRQGRMKAEISDLSRPENVHERQYTKLLEVYQGMRTPTGTQLLFETYLRYDTVTANGRRVLLAFAPALAIGLVLLWLVQLPLAIGLARRVRRGEGRERDLLARAVESSEQERRRIAADLHDSVVQGLAGASMSLSALAAAARRSNDPVMATALSGQAQDLRQWVRDLRTLVVSIAPPRLHEEGLAAALDDLASTAQSRGVEATIEVDEALRLGRTAEALVFRGAQEALRNTLDHAAASHVAIRVDNGGPMVRLRVTDDGAGFDPAELAERRSAGHVGLRLLGQLADDAGGSLTVDAQPGRGTTVLMEVPAE